jgi:hypothetical protein
LDAKIPLRGSLLSAILQFDAELPFQPSAGATAAVAGTAAGAVVVGGLGWMDAHPVITVGGGVGIGCLVIAGIYYFNKWMAA